MSAELHRVLRHLLHHHSNMLRLLALLELEITRHYREGRLNMDLIKGVLEYALTYPDLRHHPREDKLLERMLAQNPLAAGTALDLISQHKRLGELTRRLSAAFYNLGHGHGTSIEEFDDLAKTFISELREHMRNEEASFFPAATRSLRQEDWHTLDEKILPDSGLAVTGDGIDIEYQALHDRILTMVA